MNFNKGILILSLLCFGASFQVADQTEVPVQEPLKIICPKCGKVLYICNVEEFYLKEPILFDLCLPINGMPRFGPGMSPRCPLDGVAPYRNYNENSGYSTDFFTNKGWMPQRERPQ